MARTGFAAASSPAPSRQASRRSRPCRTPPPPPILFAADNAPALGGDLFRLGANGRRVNLTNSPFADEYPLVSPNGKRVAFVSNRSGSPGIYVVGIDDSLRTDGSDVRRLTTNVDAYTVNWRR